MTVANAGPDTATGVIVTDLLPAGLAFVSAGTSQGSYTPATGIWSVGTLAGNTGHPRHPGSGDHDATLYNYAQVTASDQADPDSTPRNNSQTEDDDAEATVQASTTNADLSLTKTASDTTPDIGVDFTFTLTVANAAGGGQATGVVVRDLLPTACASFRRPPARAPTTPRPGSGPSASSTAVPTQRWS